MARATGPGRRPGNSGTRESILAAARRQFAELGYDRTSIRQIAIEADVDPALVRHFHGTKQELFVSVIELPIDPETVLPALLAGDPGAVGERLAGFLLSVIEADPAGSPIVGLARAAASEPAAARLVRDLVTARILTPLTEALGVEDAALRASLLASQVVGLTFARYIVGIEPIASLPREQVAAAIGPTLQHYLTGDIGAPPTQGDR